MDAARERCGPDRLGNWFAWVLGAGLLATVVAAGVHYSEEQALLGLAERARPVWLLLALALQTGTYAAQGEILRHIAGRIGHPLSRRAAFGLSLAKLFADQALPSAGLSSGVFLVKALAQRQVPAAAARAAVMINVASYHLAYLLALLAAVVIFHRQGWLHPLVGLVAGLFLLLSLSVVAAILLLPGRAQRNSAPFSRFDPIRRIVTFIEQADASLVRQPLVMFRATVLQLAIFLLDTATLWVLVLAMGVTAPGAGVFASFMIASLFRTMGFLPGGLGTFEATSVLTLRLIGVDVATALSATLLFRGLSFWLPMLPGYWLARRAVHR